MTFWCVLSFWTSRNSLLFADTLETLQGRPVWTEAISWFHGRPTACLLTPAILTWWKETPQVWFLLRSLNTCRKNWFFLLIFVLVPNMIMPDVACSAVLCLEPYMADLSEHVFPWSSRTRRSAQENRNSEVSGSAEHHCLTLHGRIHSWTHHYSHRSNLWESVSVCC